MPQEDPYGLQAYDHALLEVEVSPSRQTDFTERYRAATGTVVAPGDPPEFQVQNNKWGIECRIYFNSDVVAHGFRSMGIHVEEEMPYRSNYRYRVNDGKLWWTLVESYGFRLGVN